MATMQRGTGALKAAATGKTAEEVSTTGMSEADVSKMKLAKLQEQVRMMEPEIGKILGASANPAAWTSAVLAAIMENWELIDADRSSFFQSCREAAQDGLLPDGNDAVLNVYRTNIGTRDAPQWIPKVQYLPMVGGVVKMLYRSGEVTKISAHCVYEADVFDYELGDEEKLIHKPNLLAPKRGDIIASYVVFTLRNGEKIREVLPKSDIDKIRGASKSANGPAWSKWFDQMAIKSVIHRGSKRVPQSPVFQQFQSRDYEAMGFQAIAASAPQEPTLALTHDAPEIIPHQTSAQADGAEITIERDESVDDAKDVAEKKPTTVEMVLDIAPTAKNADAFEVLLDWYSHVPLHETAKVNESMIEAAKRCGVEWTPK
jgi:recombination protein RecT